MTMNRRVVSSKRQAGRVNLPDVIKVIASTGTRNYQNLNTQAVAVNGCALILFAGFGVKSDNRFVEADVSSIAFRSCARSPAVQAQRCLCGNHFNASTCPRQAGPPLTSVGAGDGYKWHVK